MADSKPDTTAVHGSRRARGAYGAVAQPIVQSATFEIESTQALRQHALGESAILDYSRYANPTVIDAERRVAALEDAEASMLTSSGMSALSTLFLCMLKPGHHVVLLADHYRPSAELIRGLLGKFGVTSSIVPMGDYDALEEECVKTSARILFTELPTNPHVRLVDLERLAAIKSKVRGLKLVIDGTLATPANIRPLKRGADIVVYSLSKYHSGHNDVIAGAVVGSKRVIDALRESRALLGGTLDPNTAYLVIRGMKTFHLRMQRHNQNAEAVAAALDAHAGVARVWYPTVPDHPEHDMSRQMMCGFGGVVSFVAAGGAEHAGRIVERVKVITHAGSLGGVESLIHQPAVFSYSDIPDEVREQMGMEGGLLRLSVGLEDAQDIIDDISQAIDDALAPAANPEDAHGG